MGPKQHRTPAGTKTKRNLQRNQLTHTPPLPALSSPVSSSHHSSHTLPSQSLFFFFCGHDCNISGVWAAVLQKGLWGRLFLPFPLFHWCFQRTDGDYFWSVPLRSASEASLNFRVTAFSYPLQKKSLESSHCTMPYGQLQSDDQKGLKLFCFQTALMKQDYKWTLKWSAISCVLIWGFSAPCSFLNMAIVRSQSKLVHCSKIQISPIRKLNLAGGGQARENMTIGKIRKIIVMTWDSFWFFCDLLSVCFHFHLSFIFFLLLSSLFIINF